jgi:hypothetical protein
MHAHAQTIELARHSFARSATGLDVVDRLLQPLAGLPVRPDEQAFVRRRYEDKNPVVLENVCFVHSACAIIAQLYISEYFNCAYVWMRDGRRHASLISFHSDLNTFYDEHAEEYSVPATPQQCARVGDVVCVYLTGHSVQEHWARAELIAGRDNTIDMICVDFGTIWPFTVAMRVCYLHVRFADEPPHTWLLRVDDIRPPPASDD